MSSYDFFTANGHKLRNVEPISRARFRFHFQISLVQGSIDLDLAFNKLVIFQT